MNKSNNSKLKITQEQYDRIFVAGLIKEQQIPKVKGGPTRVDKEFKKSFGGENISSINVTEDMRTQEFSITKPNPSLSTSAQGKFGKPMMEGGDQLKQEVSELIKYLYRKSNIFSPFWSENNLSYDDICSALESSNLIIKKDGGYELSKSTGSPEKAISAVEEELRGMLGNDETPKTDIEEGDWFDGLPNNPTNQPEPQYDRGTTVQNPTLQVINHNGEFALVRGEDGSLYAFEYAYKDKKIFEPYVDREAIDSEPDGEGGASLTYSDDWDIDNEVLTNYINDNLSSFRIGQGIDDYYSGNFDLVKVDDALKQDLLGMYDKDTTVTETLNGINKDKSPEELARLKNAIAQRRSNSQQQDTERFNKRDAENKNDIKKNMNSKHAISPEPKKPVGQYNMFGGVDEMDGGAMGGTNTASVGGQYTPSLSGGQDVVKKRMPNVPVVKEESGLGDGYTHFAIFKNDGKIADGWDYNGVDNESIKHYSKIDLVDNFPELKPSEFKIVTRRILEKNGINPSDTNNWYKPTMNETLDVAGAGNFQYDTPGGLTMDLGKNNSKTKAETKTQWAGGSFVDFNDCVKLNNKTAGTGCSGGAVDNVVKLKQSKGNVNAPSLGENKIYETIAKKTGKSIDEIKAIISAKKTNG